MDLRVHHRRAVEVDPGVVRQLRQGLFGVGKRVAPPEVGEDQLHVRIAAAKLADLGDVGRVAQAVGLGHVQREPRAPLVEDLQLVMGQEIEDARLQVLVARGRILADHPIIRLLPPTTRGRLSSSTSAWPTTADGPPPGNTSRGGRSADSLAVAAIDVVIQVRHAEGETGELAVRQDDLAAAGGGRGPDRVVDLVDPVFMAFRLRGRFAAKLGLGDVGVGVEDSPRQPVGKVLLPEVAVHVGVRPNVMQGDWFHKEEEGGRRKK